MIHVCFAFHDKTGRYAKFTGTAMLSVFENTNSDVTVHILHDNTLTEDNRDKFIYLAGRYNQAVKFYNVETLCPDKVSEIVNLAPEVKNYRITVGALYRLLAPAILPHNIDKIIYLDSDIIVNLDIKELWQIELGDKILAAVPEILSNKSIEHMNRYFNMCGDGIVKCEDYFNSGVLSANLNRLREEEIKITNGLRFRAQNPRYHDYFDQNVLNYCFSTQALKLPIKFNRFTGYARSSNEPVGKKIYHFAGGSFGYGLGLDVTDPFNRLWMSYFLKTPWFNENLIQNIYGGFRQIREELEDYLVKLSSLMQGRKRAFFIEPNKAEIMKQHFSIREDEEVILAEGENAVKKLIAAMKKSGGKSVFFIITGGYFKQRFPGPQLIKEGFVSGRDFVNGWDILSASRGASFNSLPIIKAI